MLKAKPLMYHLLLDNVEQRVVDALIGHSPGWFSQPGEITVPVIDQVDDALWNQIGPTLDPRRGCIFNQLHEDLQ